MMRPRICWILVSLIFAGGVHSATIHVPSDQATIQAGIDIATAGDTVLVADGTYSGAGNRDMDFNGKAVVLLSENGPQHTIIDCGGSATVPHRAFHFHSGEDFTTVVQGFTIRGGYQYVDDVTPVYGGAVLCDTASPTFADCVLRDNFSYYGGGAVMVRSGSPRFVDCSFTANHAAYRGGAAYCRESAAHFLRCLFDSDSSGHGGGALEILSNSPAVLDECQFLNNVCYSGGSGGAVRYQYSSSGTITNCLFAGNYAHSAGALVCFENSSPAITGCTFVGNGGLGNAAAIHCGEASSPILQQCLIAYNFGGIAVYCYAGGASCYPSLSCCNVYGNEQGDWVNCISGQAHSNGNLSQDPLFCDTTGGDYHVSSQSPCAPANNSCGVLIGVHGIGCGPVIRTWYVTADGSGDAPTIQAAIDSCVNNDTVLVAAGTFTGVGNRDIELRGKRLLLISESGPEQTVIDCQGSVPEPHRAFYIHQGEDSTTVVSGFTVINGHADVANGGGMLIDAASPLISDCRFQSNHAYSGGGVACINVTRLVRFADCLFEGNQAANNGGALYTGGSVALSTCAAKDNTAGANGGAVHFFSADTSIYGSDTSYADYCIFAGNQAGSNGGAFYVAGVSPFATNCTFFGNSSSFGGAITVTSYSHPVLINSVVAFNRGGSAVFCIGPYANPYLTCSDVYGNDGGDWTGCIIAQFGQHGNFSADPWFCDTAAGDLHIAEKSPCAPENNSCSTLIGALEVGCSGTKAIIEPNVMGIPQVKSPVSPAATIHIGNFDGGYLASDVDPATLQINSFVAPTSWLVLPDHPAFDGEVMQLTCLIDEFLSGYGTQYDVTIQAYSVTGEFTDSQEFDAQGTVTIVGHLTGDLDHSGGINVADVTYFVAYLFLGGPPPLFAGTADLDKNGQGNVVDLTLLVEYLFGGE